jgi:hypothetical protein
MTEKGQSNKPHIGTSRIEETDALHTLRHVGDLAHLVQITAVAFAPAYQANGSICCATTRTFLKPKLHHNVKRDLNK